MNYLDLQYGVCGVYAIMNCVNGQVYIGSAMDIKRRWVVHVNRLRAETYTTHTSPILWSAWKKYGESSFDFFVLEEVPDRLWLMVREQLWLNDVQPWKRENGYNILPTAESRLGHIASEETRRKSSVATTRAKLGKPLSQEHCEAISRGHIGKPWTDKQREADRSRAYITEDWRAANSVRTSGENNPFFGKTHPSELLPTLQQAAVLGRHTRWHVNRGIVNPACGLCEIGVS